MHPIVSRTTRLLIPLCLIALAAGAVAAQAEAKKVVGSSKADKLKGTKKSDKLIGKGGSDKLIGKAGKDKLKGGRGKDKLKGGSGKDKLKGGGGKDKLKGGSGKDKLVGGGGVDVLAGGSGKDTLKARDGKVDRRINGGPGKDRCIVDPEEVDRVKGCETVVGAPEQGGPDTGGGGNPAPGGPDNPGGPIGPGDPGPSTPSPGGLTITSITGAECSSPIPTCPFTITGTGAAAAAGTVSGGDGVTLAAGAAVSPAGDGAWTATGLYGCTGDGFLRVTIGEPSVDAPITCDSRLGGGDAGNGPLTITGSTVDCTPVPLLQRAVCTYALNGTGADLPAGVLTGSDGLLVSAGAATADAVGLWTVAGALGTCTGDGSLTVTIGGESVALPVDCPV